MERRDRRDLYQGYGDTLSRAVEFVVTPCLLALLGRLLDGWLGSGAVFTVVLAAVGVVGMFMRTWYSYVEAMKAEEAKAPWRKS